MKKILRGSKIVGAVLLSISLLYSCNSLDNPEITSEELMAHIEYLASDELQGRYPGTEGDSLAADYIRNAYTSNGLDLLADNGFQYIDIITEVEMGDSNSFSWNRRNLNLNTEFIPLSFSGSGIASGELIFAGFGISIDNPEFTYNDYSNIDAEGKIVMILEGGPEPEEGGDDPFIGYLNQRYKILNAKDRGAKAVVFVAGVDFDPQDKLGFMAKKEPSVGLPVVRLKRSVADELLKNHDITIDNLEKNSLEGEESLLQIQENVTIQTDLFSKEASTQNVVGLLKGKNYPNDSIIVVGGHYDHLGLGGPGTGTRVPDTTAVHYGADDNASGVSAFIEIAGYLNEQKKDLDVSVVFIAFAGEEMGLIGSKYFAENPVIDLKKVRAMVNLDMVGRLKESNQLNVGGVGTAKEFRDLLETVNEDRFVLGISNEGYGPSDHASFYAKDISVLFISTGANIDYHTPNDNIAKINQEGTLRVVEWTAELLSALVKEEALSFQEAGPKQQSTGRSGFKVTMGLMPDVAGNSANGLRVEFVTDGRPAQQAGMQKGDILVGINGLPVTNIYDYMTRLQTLEAGKTATVEVIRDEKKIVLLVQL